MSELTDVEENEIVIYLLIVPVKTFFILSYKNKLIRQFSNINEEKIKVARSYLI